MSGTPDPGEAAWGSPGPRENVDAPGSTSSTAGSTRTGPEPGPPGRPGDDIFDRIRGFAAVRRSEDRWIAGVAGALSDRFDIDRTLIRGIFVALCLVGGAGVGLYGLCWLLLPQDDGRIHLQEAVRGRFSAGFVGAVLFSLALFGGGSWAGRDGFWGFSGTFIMVALIVGGVWWAARRTPQPGTAANQVSTPTQAPTSNPVTASNPTAPQGPGVMPSPAPAPTPTAPGAPIPPTARSRHQGLSAQEEAAWQRHEELRAARTRTAPSRRIRRLTLGLTLIAVAAVLAAESIVGLRGAAGLNALGVAIIVIACGVIANGLSGRRSPGLAGLGFLLVLLLAIGTGAQHAGLQTSRHLAVVGHASWAPQSRAAAQDQYNLGIGEARLDLTSAGALSGADPDSPLRVEVNVGVGHLMLILPDWVTVEVETQLGVGEVVEPDGNSYEVRGNSDSRSRTLTYGSGDPDVIVVAQQGVGQLEIDRVDRTGEEN